ncbi:MAG: hypothetical protein COV37_14830 [Bdellovibrio sp. CG11_big_fil_rev_8_21_14_0_20_39_38]|nr:MAG: hypothetical protein COW78_15620 [Bdellovibrio sp. CG22_combo_CG10-13_8_21_14_all_39_27]PIR33867.1 MAG: hypothetical protein COV37_14830 [Bdellovibrio sp. CG11_big_fil_rev_8_21_14_0_20_39_38]
MKMLLCALILVTQSAMAFDWNEPDWSANSTLPAEGSRQNLYQLPEDQFSQIQDVGYVHALRWPVNVSGLYIPYKPLENFLESDSNNPIKRLIQKFGQRRLGYSDMDGLYAWLGLNKYPDEGSVTGIYRIPFPDGFKPKYRMGASILNLNGVQGLTFGCAGCHSGVFMGRTIMGLTNKRPRANEFFMMAKKYVPKIPSHLFAYGTNASEEERKLYKYTQDNLRAVGAVMPQSLGLDTSLPHVALSLSHRKDDEYATKSRVLERNPTPNKLETMVADSKPLPWWNLKHKTRWLSDGSIVAGNPILTNFLWNELGRGTDLKELEQWMKDNQDTVRELTAAAFATQAPRWTDFFPAGSIDLDSAKRGQTLFKNSCQKCHGEYQKAWDLPNASELSEVEILSNSKVLYPKKTEVKDVGTDPNRWMATQYFAERLNKLRISKWMKTVVEPQKGYVPPPLEGIFSRYPYFHNNSIPNLCALMEHPTRRPKFFVQGPSTDASHYDADCVGYPVGDKIPASWMKEKEAHYKANKPGLLNIGHSKAFYDEQSQPLMSESEKRDLRMFLKTL